MSSTADTDPRNLSFFVVPIVFVSTCGFPTIYASLKAGNIYDNANPRAFRDAVSKSETLTKEKKQHILRAKGASENGFENIGLFAAAVVAVNHAGVDTWLVNCLTIGYLATRIAYVFAYIWLGRDRRLAWVRSVCFGMSAFTIMGLWITAGFSL